MPDRKLCILAIDDTAMQLHVLIKILQPSYTVRVAKDGLTGLEFARRYEIDLILLDMVMEGMSGLQVLSALKESELTRDIPVIIVSGNTSDSDVSAGLGLGASRYIKKPFEHETVLNNVKQVLEGRQ